MPLGARIERIEHLLEKLAQHAGAQLSPFDANLNVGGEAETSDYDAAAADESQDPKMGERSVIRLEDPEVCDDMKPTIYQNSIFSSLLSPPNLARMSERTGDPNFGKNFTNAVQSCFRRRNEQLNMLLMQCHTGPTLLDPAIEQICMQLHSQSPSDFLRALVRPDEWDEMKMQTPTAYAISKPSLIVLLLAHLSSVTHIHGFSQEFIRQQRIVAFTQATRAWSVSGLTHPTACLFRALVLYALAAAIFNPSPQTYHAVAIAQRVGQHMGLHRAEVYEDMDPASRHRTLEVWWILHSYDFCLSMMGGHPPGLRSFEISTPLPNPLWPDNSDLFMLSYSSKLAFIYDKLYERVFSVSAVKKPSQLIINDIHILNEELENWHQSLPKDIGLYTSDDGCNAHFPLPFYFASLANHVIKMYYLLKIQLFATPAFMPSFFREAGHSGTSELATSATDIATTSARSLMELALKDGRKDKPEPPLSGFCLVTANKVLFLNSLKYPLGEFFDRDVEMIKSLFKVKNHELVCQSDIIWSLELEALEKVRNRFVVGQSQGVGPRDLPAASTQIGPTHLMPVAKLETGNSPFEVIPWSDPTVDLFPEFAAAEVSGETCIIS